MPGPGRRSFIINFNDDISAPEDTAGAPNQGAMAIDSNTFASLAVVQLNCHAMDFDGILAQHFRGIDMAIKQNATYIVFPELSLSGYSCEDHFLELDTEVHCWGSLNKLLLRAPKDVLIDVGLPVTFRGARYNCRAYLLNGDIIGIRPKCFLAMEGNYREARYFTSWERTGPVDSLRIQLQQEDGTRVIKECPFGRMVLKCNDLTIASEICEEMWTPRPLHLDYYLQGVDIVSNASGSHHSLQKLERRLMIIKTATTKTGGVYMYSNFKGNDGTRNNFDGKSAIAVNGDIISAASSLTIDSDVEVIVEEIDMTTVRTYRSQSPTGMIQGMVEQISTRPYFLDVPIYICRRNASQIKSLPDWHARSPFNIHTRQGFGMRLPKAEAQAAAPENESEECILAGSSWLWDYLRRVKGAKGFFIPLSGGSDSASCAVIVHYMCLQLAQQIKKGTRDVIRDVMRVLEVSEDECMKLSDKDICKRLLCTAYEGTSNSSDRTRGFSRDLSAEIGASHLDMNIQPIYEAFKQVVEDQLVDKDGTQTKLLFENQGGIRTTDLVLQNIQSRSRMVLSYALASVFPGIIRKCRPDKFGGPTDGFFLTIATGNQCETLSGYYTKYDCSSGDLNPIASLNKFQIIGILDYAQTTLGIRSVVPIREARPSAELRPVLEGVWDEQDDEKDMGLTYSEISAFAYYRMTERCGPLQTFNRLLCEWSDLSPRDVAEKVKRFFTSYANNRHKGATVTAGLHMSSRNPDDNRYDHRQLFYPAWTRQFTAIDTIVTRLEGKHLDIPSEVPLEGRSEME